MRIRQPKDSPIYLDTIHSFLTLFRYLRHYSRDVHDSGRSGRELSTLRYLQDNGPTTMGQLSAFLYISESSTTELVAKLEQESLATRKRSANDNRVVEVDLTEQGRRLAASTALGGIPLLRERLRTLPREELEQILDAFRRLNRLLGVQEEK
jgi:DNA-binding MarR family transcriptional regulator